MSVRDDIEQLHEDYGSLLAPYLWASEDDRWTEFIFCLLNQCEPQDPEGARSALEILKDLELVDPASLVLLVDPESEESTVVSYVLRRNGFSTVNAHHAVELLRIAAELTNEAYGGKLQRFLREYGNRMRDDLMKRFESLDLPEPKLRYAMTHWLQNVLSLPITLESEAVREWCAVNKITVDDLVQVCDDLGVNPAVIDDLVEFKLSIEAETSARTTTIDSP